VTPPLLHRGHSLPFPSSQFLLHLYTPCGACRKFLHADTFKHFPSYSCTHPLPSLGCSSRQRNPLLSLSACKSAGLPEGYPSRSIGREEKRGDGKRRGKLSVCRTTAREKKKKKRPEDLEDHLTCGQKFQRSTGQDKKQSKERTKERTTAREAKTQKNKTTDKHGPMECQPIKPSSCNQSIDSQASSSPLCLRTIDRPINPALQLVA